MPPGAGDRGNFKLLRSEVIPEVAPGSPVNVPARWDVTPSDTGHTCLLVQIADYKLPENPADGAALASDDVWVANNKAQKNVDQFVAVGASPYQPIEFEYSVNNDGAQPEIAYLEPQDLPYGMRLTVSPSRRRIAPKETAIFTCRLELDHRIIDVGCQNDREFTIVTWRVTPDTVVRWGACQYKIRPRKKTVTTVEGSWGKVIPIYGKVEPDPGGGQVRVRVNFDNAQSYWRPVPLAPGGTYRFDLQRQSGAKSVEVVAMYEGSTLLAPSRSAPKLIKYYGPEVR